MPPCTWIERSHAATAASPQNAFAAAHAMSTCSSLSATHHAAQYASERASSVSTYVFGELVRDRLVRADRLAELLPLLRVLDRELERLRRDADRLERERRELLVLRRGVVEELAAAIRASGLFVEDGAIEEAELGDLVATPAAVREHRARLAPQRLLVVGEGKLHQRLLGRPSTRSAMMLRRISLVPASIVLPRERSCW